MRVRVPPAAPPKFVKLNMKANNFFSKESGFTLIELLVILSIISILSSAALVSLKRAIATTRDAVRLSDMRQLKMALEMFYQEHGHYPGATYEGVSNSGEMIGDNNGPIEQALAPYLQEIPCDPLHDGTVYFYSYDPQHCTDDPVGSCNCSGPVGAVLAFNRAETNAFYLNKDTCSGGDMNQDDADYNIVFFPPGP